jgi:CDP-4-dehydro-6-deoxyglucose reductase
MNTQQTKALVVQMTPLTDTILQLVLEPEQYIDYQAGQYLKLLLGETELYYSIANAPLGSRRYELHIRHSRDNPFDARLFDEIKQNGAITLQAPFGQCDFAHLDPHLPIIFIAAGTGFSPVNAIIEQLLALGDPRSFELIWSARTQSDLYLDEKVKKWQNQVPQFQYTTLLSSFQQQTPATMLLSRDVSDLQAWQFVISGPLDMVFSTRDQLVAHGVPVNRLHSDAFQFEGG